MRENDYIVNLDRLCICYTSTDEVYQSLAETTKWDLGTFTLTAIVSENRKTILAVDAMVEVGIYERIGTLQIGHDFESSTEERLVWFAIENRILYPSDEQHNYMYLIDYIATELRLQFHNLSAMDICLDTDKKDFVKRIKKGVKKFVPIVLDRAYEDKVEEIKKYFVLQRYNRLGVLDETVYVCNSDKTCVFTVYNKTLELQESEKEYIKAQHKDGVVYWRAEVRLRNKAIRQFLESKGMSYEDLYAQIVVFGNKDLMADILAHFSYRAMHFRDEKGKCLTVFALPR